MEQFKEKIKELNNRLKDPDKLHLDKEPKSGVGYPFNKYTNILSYFLSKDVLTFNEYQTIRDEYFERNPYLELFEKAPRTFGQTWGEEWLKDQIKSLQDPPQLDVNRKLYDLWLPSQGGNGIKIEVKSSHVAQKDPSRILVEKAYKKPKDGDILAEIEKQNFEMNFQQLKPDCCDVFVWLAVWLDYIDIWVLPASIIKMRQKGAPRRKPKDSIVNQDGTIYMGTQHQGGKGGKVAEGQIFINNKNYKDLEPYRVSLGTLIKRIKKYGNINQNP